MAEHARHLLLGWDHNAQASYPSLATVGWGRYEPDDLFRHRPPLDRLMGLEDMEQAIASGVASPER
ncbi:MAG: hypothetical protein ACK522_04080 [Synechococcaceae cyanobacterium]